MAVIAAQTRKQIRQTIGYRLGAVVVSSTTSAGTTSSFADTELPNSDGFANGKHFVQASGDNDGSIRIVEEFTGGPKTGVLRTAMGSTIASGVTYELWDEDMPPARVHDAINEAIRAVTRKASPPSTDTSIHTSTKLTTYSIPTAVVGIRRVDYRDRYDREDIDNADAVWSELVDTDVTASLDDEDYREGSGSNKFVLAAGLAANDIIASENVSTVDLSGMTHVEWWAKSTVTTTAGDLQLILSTTASAGTETELLDFPALTAGEWTRCRVALANPESDSAIISVGIKYTTDIGAATIWIDGIEGTLDNSEVWTPIHRNFWNIDKDSRELVFERSARWEARHALLRITGRKKPTELASDTDSCDVDPEYIINYATAQLMRARGDRNASNREAAHIEADRLMQLAIDWRRRIHSPTGIRWVDDA